MDLSIEAQWFSGAKLPISIYSLTGFISYFCKSCANESSFQKSPPVYTRGAKCDVEREITPFTFRLLPHKAVPWPRGEISFPQQRHKGLIYS